jgi:hypothetical protein
MLNVSWKKPDTLGELSMIPTFLTFVDDVGLPPTVRVDGASISGRSLSIDFPLFLSNEFLKWLYNFKKTSVKIGNRLFGGVFPVAVSVSDRFVNVEFSYDYREDSSVEKLDAFEQLKYSSDPDEREAYAEVTQYLKEAKEWKL